MFEQYLLDMDKRHRLRHLTVIDAREGPFVTVNGARLLLMCSNDYLGISGHPALCDAARDALQRYGFGAGASRLVSGTSPLHQKLENRIALFKRTDTALLFNSGYAANTGIIPALVEEGDVIFSDALNHASIVDGCRLSKARVEIYRHCDAGHLEELLTKSSPRGRMLIVTDAVFSMDGDIAPLRELVFLAEKYHAMLMVDDAHATGVLGESGRGTLEHFGLSGRVAIQMGTLGKALGSFGAFAAGSRDLIDYLLNRSRSFMFSTALPPLVCAASIAAFDIVEKEPERRDTLWKNRERLVRGLAALAIPIENSQTPIIPIIIGDSEKALTVCNKLSEYGIYAAAIRPPTVPAGKARIRLTVTAGFSDENIDQALDAFSRLKKENYL